MAIVRGNYTIYTNHPVFDERGNLIDWVVRVNSAYVEDTTGAILPGGIPTTRDTSVLHLILPEEQAVIAAVAMRIQAALPTLDYGD